MTDTDTIREAIWNGGARHGPRFDAAVDALARVEARLREQAAEYEVQRDYADACYRKQLAAEARLREAETALAPFARGSEAFDNAGSTYGDGPVFERITSTGHWQFTIADVRAARAYLEGQQT
jgi:hypothetical protein